jgi:hypothetical protein
MQAAGPAKRSSIPQPRQGVNPPDPPQRLLDASFVLGRRVARVGPHRQLRGLERVRSRAAGSASRAEGRCPVPLGVRECTAP